MSAEVTSQAPATTTTEAPRRRIPAKEIRLRRFLVSLLRRHRDVENRLAASSARERRLLKRTRGTEESQEEANTSEPPTKRLRAQVVLPAQEESSSAQAPKPAEERRPAPAAPQNRRFLGNLLFGTLKAIKKDTAEEMKTEVNQKRTQILSEIEEKESKESERVREAQLIQEKEMKVKLEELVTSLQEQIEQARTELEAVRKERQDWLVSGFLKTETGPSIYWLPAKVDDFVTNELGLKPRIELVDELKNEAEEAESEDEEEKETEKEARERLEDKLEDEDEQRPKSEAVIEEGEL